MTLSNDKIFADDTSLFPEVFNTINSENTLNVDLKSISNWAYQWNIQFNTDPKKLANEVIFLSEIKYSFISCSHNWSHTITGAMQGTSRKRLYDELGLMSLKERRWHNKLNFFIR